MSLLCLHLSPSSLPFSLSLSFGLEILSSLVSCILRVDWRTKTGRASRGATGPHRLNDGSFQRVIRSALSLHWVADE